MFVALVTSVTDTVVMWVTFWGLDARYSCENTERLLAQYCRGPERLNMSPTSQICHQNRCRLFFGSSTHRLSQTALSRFPCYNLGLKSVELKLKIKFTRVLNWSRFGEFWFSSKY